jgi:carboxypeptidase T
MKRFIIGFLCLAASAAWASTYRVALHPRDYLASLRSLASRHLDISGADWQAGTIELVTDDEGLKALKALGEPLDLRAVFTENAGASWLEPYTDPEEMEQFITDLAAQHPDLMEVVPLTDPLYEGHIVYAVKITHGGGVKPVFFMDAQHHAREVMTAEIARDAIQYLVSHYGTDPQATHWVDAIEIWIVPIVNPDGADYCFKQDSNWRKNRYPGCGVDLNRNYEFSWNQCRGSSAKCQADDYRGTGAASEAEARGVTTLMEAVKPLFYLTYHSYGQYIIWPYGCDYSPEDDALAEIGGALNSVLQDDTGRTGNYRMGTSFDTLYLTDGTSDDESYGRMGTFSYCIEVNSDRAGGFQPDYNHWRDATVQRQRTAWQFFLDQTLNGPLVRCNVISAVGRRPMAGATVSVEGITFGNGEPPRTTDALGRYTFIGRKNTAYTLTFSAPGFSPLTQTVAIGDGPVDLDVVLLPTFLPPVYHLNVR